MKCFKFAFKDLQECIKKNDINILLKILLINKYNIIFIFTNNFTFYLNILLPQITIKKLFFIYLD